MGIEQAESYDRRVFLFGGLRVEDSLGARHIPGGGALALLVYLVLHPETGHTREKLADLLWEDADPERTRRRFSDTLYRLRQALGDGWLITEGETLCLNAAAAIWADVWAFEQLRATKTPEATQQAVELYRGDLAPEVAADWILPRRVLLRECYLNDLLELGRRAEADSELEEAFKHYHTLSFGDPLREDAHRGLMRVYAGLGRHAAALQQYRTLERVLAEELGVEPTTDTKTLAQTVRREHEAKSAAPPRSKPFVGRRAERASLLRWVEMARTGAGRLVLVEGAPGAGKTRLLDVLAESAAWRGLNVARGRSEEPSAQMPYEPLDQALAQVFSGVHGERARSRLPAATVEALGGLVPRFAAEAPMHFSKPPDLQGALLAGLQAVTAEGPLVLILDDVHWAGPAMWDLLDFARQIKDLPLMVILAYRGEEIRRSEQHWRALQKLDRQVQPQRLILNGLNAADCGILARELGFHLSEKRTHDLHMLTNGNPLHLEESLTSLGRSGDPGEALEDLLAGRLRTLAPKTRAALEAAAVLGTEFEHGTWQATAGSDVLRSLPDLLEGRFIQEGGQGYRFQHDLTREAVYEAIPVDRRRALHRQAAEQLLKERSRPETLAWHFENARLWPEASRQYRRAGERAMQLYAFETALIHFERSLALVERQERIQQADRLPTLLMRQRAHRVLLRMQDWTADLDEIERLAAETGDRSAHLEAAEARISLHVLNGDLDRMRADAARALEIAQALGEDVAEARIRGLLGWHLAESLGRNTEAIDQLERAVSLAEVHGRDDLLVNILCNLAFAQRSHGRCVAARENAARALAITELRPELYPLRAHALKSLADVTFELADYEAARRAFQAAIELYNELNDPWSAGACYYNFGLCASAMGQHAEARDAMERLIEVGKGVGIAPDSTYGIWHRAGLARACIHAGEFEEAELILGELPHDQDAGGRAQLTALILSGWLLLRQGRPDEARRVLERSLTIWNRNRQGDESYCSLLHALACHRSGDQAAARASLEEFDRTSEGSESGRNKILAGFVRAEISGKAGVWRAAGRELDRQAGLFEDDRLRNDFLQEVFLHRQIRDRLRPSIPARNRISVRMARREAPLGKTLTEAEYIGVLLTIDAGEADRELLAREGKVALRRHRILRLIEEAQEQGAAPTDEDLGAALAVSTRTIERDMAALREQGRRIQTRRRQ